MKNLWHEQIQRYLNGQTSAAEAAALQAALNQDAELRALYLDYINLDVALGAAAEAATIPEDAIGGITKFPGLPAQSAPQYGSWLAAAACAVVLLFVVAHRNRNLSPSRPDVAGACSSAQEAIARLSVEPLSLFPTWASPTASLLDQPRTPKWDM